ncbi:MAG: secondary thiamine-phosphate synthase enzyme YjbQ [Hyphomicrobiales bacterium]|nr:secondary thiamine-phosphate synthase enzyme YjbQ [Hyphomicrobiales bacterium]
MRQASAILNFSTSGMGLYDVTEKIRRWLAEQNAEQGLLTLFCRHTSASLLIQENADPSVQRDLERAFAQLAPEGRPYEHDSEGPDDMPAHIRAALTQTQLSVPIIGGRMALGVWQAIYLFEHRRAPHKREIVAHFIGA